MVRMALDANSGLSRLRKPWDLSAVLRSCWPKARRVGRNNASYDWTSLLQRLQLGGAEATQELDFLFGRGMRYFFRRRLQRNDVEREVCDTFSMVIQSIRRGEVRESHRLASHILTHARLRAVVSPTDSVSERSPKPISRTRGSSHSLAKLRPGIGTFLSDSTLKSSQLNRSAPDLHITYPDCSC